jgi:BlaI family penicillinase repressor
LITRSFSNFTISKFADLICSNDGMDRPVIDKTGLTGTYNIKLTYVREAGRKLTLVGHALACPPRRQASPLTRRPFNGTSCHMTKRAAKGMSVRSPLTALESDVMQAVWDAGPCTVDAVHRTVARSRNIKETSIRTLLRRLELKGYLKHEEEGRAYVYRAVQPARSLAAHAVRQIIDRLCQGSMEELVSGMVDAKVLSKSEMDRLEDFVRNRKPGGK